MIERVRPAQLTTTVVDGSGASCPMRNASSPFGQQMPPGMFILRYSLHGRPSTITKSSPRSYIATSSSAVMRGVSQACSTSSPKVLLGTFTPANSWKPACFQAGAPPSRTCTAE
jgi:hypothetical protein